MDRQEKLIEDNINGRSIFDSSKLKPKSNKNVLDFERSYFNELKFILNNGVKSDDRTGTGTLRISQGADIRFCLEDGFPALRGKKVNIKNSLIETMWMLKGLTNIKFLKEYGVNYWDQWADENGYLGPCYGSQIRNFNGGLKLLKNRNIVDQTKKILLCNKFRDKIYEVDQTKNLIDEIINNPSSRRLILTFWNPSELSLQKLPPCYLTMQFLVINRELHLHATQRSGDMFLGVPYDMMNYSVFLHTISYLTNLKPGTVNIKINDAHIYVNHIEQVSEYLSVINNELYNDTTILNNKTDLVIRNSIYSTGPINSPCIDNFICNSEKQRFSNFKINGYESFPFIKAKVSI